MHPNRKLAAAAGAKHYVGPQCIRCGMSERYVVSGACVRCTKRQATERQSMAQAALRQTRKSESTGYANTLRKLRDRSTTELLTTEEYNALLFAIDVLDERAANSGEDE